MKHSITVPLYGLELRVRDPKTDEVQRRPAIAVVGAASSFDDSTEITALNVLYVDRCGDLQVGPAVGPGTLGLRPARDSTPSPDRVAAEDGAVPTQKERLVRAEALLTALYVFAAGLLHEQGDLHAESAHELVEAVDDALDDAVKAGRWTADEVRIARKLVGSLLRRTE